MSCRIVAQEDTKEYRPLTAPILSDLIPNPHYIGRETCFDMYNLGLNLRPLRDCKGSRHLDFNLGALCAVFFWGGGITGWTPGSMGSHWDIRWRHLPRTHRRSDRVQRADRCDWRYRYDGRDWRDWQ
jgi:hypothetical protein